MAYRSDRITLPQNEISRRYRTGEPTRQLGRAYGVSDKLIGRRLAEVGVTMRPAGWQRGGKNPMRRPGGPLFDYAGGYLGTMDRKGRKCLIHRAYWEARNGMIPNGWVVHHANDDKQDNAIDNLVCMSRAQHVALHGAPE